MKMIMGKLVRLSALLLLVSAVVFGIAGCGEQEESTEATNETNTETPTNETGDTSIALTVTKGTDTSSYTLAEVKALPSEEGWGGIMNSSGVISGPFKQKGVPIMDLLEKVGGISEGDAMRITAKDGYTMTYSYDQIANGNFTTLDCSTGEEVPHDTLTAILAYEEDGIALTDQNGPLRIAILNGNTQVTEGHWWVKWVTDIEVVAGEEDWNLHLEGYMDEDIDPNTFESCAAPGCHGVSWSDDQNRVWEGIPLWMLVGRVDDDNSHSKETQAFNDTVADAGYEVEVIAADGFSKTFTSEEIRRNNDFIISYRRDGEPLPENQWPLRLVGPNLEKGQMVGQVATIKVTLPESVATEEPEWILTLKGELEEEIDDSYFAAAFEDCHSASWTDDENRVWEGIPLWLFVGRVDDDFKHNPNEPGAFNDDLADAGYEVVVTAADGYSKSFTSEEIKRNDNMIIAFRRDGGPLPENQWPLRLVGPDLTKGQMVGQITTIEVVFP